MFSGMTDYQAAAAATDRLNRDQHYVGLLAAGLLGEAGSLVAELKKSQREGIVHRASRAWILEEFGDMIWYFVRLCEEVAPDLLEQRNMAPTIPEVGDGPLWAVLLLGAECGELLRSVQARNFADVRAKLLQIWHRLNALIAMSHYTVEEVVEANLKKIKSRWPAAEEYHQFFDEGLPEYEQLPRVLKVEFVDHIVKDRHVAILRCNGLNFGDRLTDNSADPDGYRFHDVFHFAFAAVLGWSPVVRALLRCKRKSIATLDENQDGARAVILEEAISATVFSRALEVNFFEGLDRVDYDLLKSVQGFVSNYEVSSVPLWQWEKAILLGFQMFRLLRAKPGGLIMLSMADRTLRYESA